MAETLFKLPLAFTSTEVNDAAQSKPKHKNFLPVPNSNLGRMTRFNQKNDKGDMT